jgi:lipoprotein-anchoring transpeptidase ErfK/SrfK
MKRVPRILTSLAAVFGLAILIGEAAAQYYPPDPSPSGPYAPRGPYREPPPDDDDDFIDPPGLIFGPPPGAYRRDPPVTAYPLEEAQPSYRPNNRRAAPSPYGPSPFADQPYDRTPTGALPDHLSPGNNDVPRNDVPRPGNDTAVARPPADIGTSGALTRAAPAPETATAALPPDDQPEEGAPKELPANLRRQVVDFPSKEPAGAIIIDTPNTYLYYVLGNGQAVRYGVGVGREGFTWAGRERIKKMVEWPDWYPPKEMIERQPYLPRFMAGGTTNPLGARALYLGNTLYRIHGTNQPSTIGQFVSSGCIRLLNEDIEDLYGRVQVGSRVVVLGNDAQTSAAPQPASSPAASKPATPPKPQKLKVSRKLPPPTPVQPPRAEVKPVEPKASNSAPVAPAIQE